MRYRIWSSYAVASACLGLCGMAAAQDQPPAEATGGSRLEVSVREWDFGEAWQGQPLKHTITLTNVGDAPLTIQVKTSCGCATPTKPKSPLGPGESTSMTLSYDSTTRPGNARQTVTLTTNDPTQRSVPIQLRGKVKPVYELKPKNGLVFGKLYQSSWETRTVEIVNKYTDKLFLKLKEGQDFGPFRIEVKEVEPGMRYTLTATTKPPLEVGRYQTKVTLSTGIGLVPQIKTLVYGFVQPPVVVRPAKLFLPRNSVTEMKRVLRVSHAPDHPIEVTGARATDDAVKVELVERQPAPAGSTPPSYQIVVTLPPGDRIAEGAEPAIEIMTSSKDPEYQKLVVPIQVIAPRQHGSLKRPGPVESVPRSVGSADTQRLPTSRPAPRAGEKPQ